MATKRPRKPRLANVAVPLDGAEFCRKLSRAIGGTIAEEFASATAAGFAPFERELSPAAYSSADSFGRDYQLAVMLSKFDDEKSSEAKKQAAIDKFRLSEEQCLSTNRRFANFVGGVLYNDVTIEACLFTAQRKIQRLLGPLNLDEVASGFGFGPGASTRLGRAQSDTWYKFQGKPETTPNNTVFSNAVFLHSPLWKQAVLSEGEESTTPYKVVRTNRVITVPKSAKIDRVIAIEPDLNLFVQKGFGAVIRRRLKKVGVDLNDQTVNQLLARQGSIDGSLATLDLSMASDTVSRAIVEQLLPPDWLQALEQCRSPEGRLPSGEIIRYQKFSSMGNGFTFELESLIFWALCSSVADLTNEMDRRISVYGDDLIVPVGIVEPVVGLLLFCGFKTNTKKSFANGPFRESCGKHFFQGHDVTPFFLRKQPRGLAMYSFYTTTLCVGLHRGDLLPADGQGLTPDCLIFVKLFGCRSQVTGESHEFLTGLATAHSSDLLTNAHRAALLQGYAVGGPRFLQSLGFFPIAADLAGSSSHCLDLSVDPTRFSGLSWWRLCRTGLDSVGETPTGDKLDPLCSPAHMVTLAHTQESLMEAILEWTGYTMTLDADLTPVEVSRDDFGWKSSTPPCQ